MKNKKTQQKNNNKKINKQTIIKVRSIFLTNSIQSFWNFPSIVMKHIWINKYIKNNNNNNNNNVLMKQHRAILFVNFHFVLKFVSKKKAQKEAISITYGQSKQTHFFFHFQ